MKIDPESIVKPAEDLTDDERETIRSDRSIPRILTHAEEVGDLSIGPVVIVHGMIDEIGSEYAHAFGPYRSIEVALENFGVQDDNCVKSIIVLRDSAGGMGLIDLQTGQAMVSAEQYAQLQDRIIEAKAKRASVRKDRVH